MTQQGSSMQGSRIADRGTSLSTLLSSKKLRRLDLSALTLRGSTIAGVTRDGRIVDVDLLGAKFSTKTLGGVELELEVAAVEHAGSLSYYTLKLADGSDLCTSGEGMFLPGVWDPRGRRYDAIVEGDELRDTTFSCTDGVLAKCVKLGYRPWEVGAELHAACTRMARADFCGDGLAHTIEGVGTFETGWGPEGAVCVDTPQDAAEKLPACWDRLPSCATFDRTRATGANGASPVLFASSTRSSALCTKE